MRSGCHHIDDRVECIFLQSLHFVSGVSKSMKRSNSLSDMNFEGLLPAAQAQESEEERHKKSIRSTSPTCHFTFTCHSIVHRHYNSLVCANIYC